MNQSMMASDSNGDFYAYSFIKNENNFDERKIFSESNRLIEMNVNYSLVKSKVMFNQIVKTLINNNYNQFDVHDQQKKHNQFESI